MIYFVLNMNVAVMRRLLLAHMRLHDWFSFIQLFYLRSEYLVTVIHNRSVPDFLFIHTKMARHPLPFFSHFQALVSYILYKTRSQKAIEKE